MIGTYPGAGYYLHPTGDTRTFFADLLKTAGVEPGLKTDNPAIQARLHSGPGGTYLWITNPTRSPARVGVVLSAALQPVQKANDVWSSNAVAIDGRKLSVDIGPRDGAVIALRR